MRAVLLVTILSAALIAAAAQERPEKPATPALDVGPGRIAWFDITTTNLARSREFYGDLLGWTFTPLAGTDLAVEIVAGDTPIGTLRVAEGSLSPHNGVVYVQVQDLPASCARSKELGGTVIPGFPFDLPDGKGAIGLLIDPSGHPLGLYSPKPLAATKPAVPAPPGAR